MILQMVLEPIINDMKLKDNVQIECISAGQAAGMISSTDLILCSEQLHGMFDIPEGKVLVTIRNLIDKNEIRGKVHSAITENFPQLLQSGGK